MTQLRKQNKLFEAVAEEYVQRQLRPPEQYRGHKLCITAFQLTPEHIYSCSKDRSIIRWDRETKQKHFISLGKDQQHHKHDILTLDLHHHHQLVATAGEDCTVKLWDHRMPQLVHTLTGHQHHINAIKFGQNSNSLCSVSSDLSVKHWDISQRGLIETFHEHTR